MASLNQQFRVRITPVNKPTDKVIFKLGDTEVTATAHDIVRKLLGSELIVTMGNPAATPAPASAPSAALPAIGSQVDGGIFAGLTIADGQAAQLILLPGDEKLNWKDAGAWAEKQGGTLPSRIDALVLFQNLKKEFKEEYYWTDQPYAGGASYAWVQSFYGGYQGDNHKDYAYRARAVRRLIIK